MSKQRWKKRKNVNKWVYKPESYEEYCERHRKAGTQPLDKIKWKKLIVESKGINL